MLASKYCSWHISSNGKHVQVFAISIEYTIGFILLSMTDEARLKAIWNQKKGESRIIKTECEEKVMEARYLSLVY
jgi:hypothetical protein